MHDKQIIITRHSYKRYRQRVGAGQLPMIRRRCQTALQCGLYRHGEGVIKLQGVWWGCEINRHTIVLVTCYGRLSYDLIRRRRQNKTATRLG